MRALDDDKPQTALKVLIADDDPPTRILLRAAIVQWGYKTIEAGDGEEAWTILQQPDAPRLLIVDWLMPKLDGTELCARIRKELSFHPYIILLTQVSGTVNIIRGLEAGADEFLSKPFKMAELRSRLSVGARIIQYENWVNQQNLNLGQLKELIDQAQIIFKKLDDPSKNKEVKEQLKNIIETLQSVQQNSVKRTIL